jgi:curved DNA-binding protein CbpA
MEIFPPERPTTVTTSDPYEILGVPADASLEEIKAAHKALAKVWHPDRFSGDPMLRAKAEDKLKSINAAYASLQSGTYQRRIYRPPTRVR